MIISQVSMLLHDDEVKGKILQDCWKAFQKSLVLTNALCGAMIERAIDLNPRMFATVLFIGAYPRISGHSCSRMKQCVINRTSGTTEIRSARSRLGIRERLRGADEVKGLQQSSSVLSPR